MPLKLRPTGLGSGTYKDKCRLQRVQRRGGSRIYERNGFPDEVRFFWSLHGVVLTRPPGMPYRWARSNMDDAKAQFQKSWDAWKAWVKLEKVP